MEKVSADNSKSQMLKGILDYCILLIIKEKPVYVADIIQVLKEAKLIVVEGTIYPLLMRLKNMQLLSYQWIESKQGPPRKYYEITDSGREYLTELEVTWDEIEQTINHLKSIY